MQRFLLFLALFLLTSTAAHAQKKKRSDYFGGGKSVRDYTEMRNYGLQITFGPNYTFTKKVNKTIAINPVSGQRYNYTFDPSGRLGGFIDIGMVHYTMRKPKFFKKNIIHYVDWGLGFDYIGGKETTTVNYLDPAGNVASTVEGNGAFYNGYVYGRVTAHRLLKLADKLHLDYGLGINANYAVLGQNKNYKDFSLPETQVFQKPFQLQLHAQLGFNIRLRRGDYLVPGIWAPVLGAYEWNSGKPTIQWYSSNYWPVHFQVKWLHSFLKKSNGCNTGTDAERQKNKEYMQNR